MDNKAVIIQILTKLQWHRALADGILALVRSVPMKAEIYDALIRILHHAYKSAQTQDEKHHLEKSLQLVEHIHQQEQNDKTLSDVDVERLLSEIDHA